MEILRVSLLTMHWVGLENQPGFLSCHVENDLFGEGTHLPGSHFPLKHDSMIVGGRVISTSSFWCD